MSTIRGSLLVLVTALVTAACVEPRCPKGYNQKGDTCYRIKDAGVADAGDAGDEFDADTSAIEVDGADTGSETGGDATDQGMDTSVEVEDAEIPVDAGGTEEASTDLCQGSGGAPVCEGPVMHHCSAAGTTERTETCPSGQQCQDGIAANACAPCLRGTFQCKEARLERCADNGKAWELKATCDSASLCNETAGACTDKACTATTRLCDDDTLTGCNAALTALEPIKKCEPGLCDQAQGECDVCVANAKSCEQDTVVSCDVNGRKETRVPCPEATPKCTGSGSCVECVRNADCTGAHELCQSNKCVVQPYCGDGKKDTGEECDPMAVGENAWTCGTQCKQTTAYTWCAGKKNAQGDTTNQGCEAGEGCLGGSCAPKCNLVGDCPAAPIGEVTCGASWKVCVATGCKAASDCPPGLICAALPDTSSISSDGGICVPCDDTHPCPTGVCMLAPGDTFKKCVSP